MPTLLPSWPGGRPAHAERIEGELHVWALALTLDEGELAALAAPLTDAERARAARFVHERDRLCSLAARGLLRELLGRYLDARPAALRIGATAAGKPILEGGSPLAFNVSHSGELVVVALARADALGVDVEAERPLPDLDGLARTVLAPEELAALAAHAPEERTAAFFRAWTRKEAYLKAVGEGLGLPLDGFAVTLDGTATPRLLRHAAPEPPEAWTLHDLAPGAGYAGAAAVRARGLTLRCRRWLA
jgi:4'-phosphopantetheinyl transferase